MFVIFLERLKARTLYDSQTFSCCFYPWWRFSIFVEASLIRLKFLAASLKIDEWEVDCERSKMITFGEFDVVEKRNFFSLMEMQIYK